MINLTTIPSFDKTSITMGELARIAEHCQCVEIETQMRYRRCEHGSWEPGPWKPVSRRTIYMRVDEEAPANATERGSR